MIFGSLILIYKWFSNSICDQKLRKFYQEEMIVIYDIHNNASQILVNPEFACDSFVIVKSVYMCIYMIVLHVKLLEVVSFEYNVICSLSRCKIELRGYGRLWSRRTATKFDFAMYWVWIFSCTCALLQMVAFWAYNCLP